MFFFSLGKNFTKMLARPIMWGLFSPDVCYFLNKIMCVLFLRRGNFGEEFKFANITPTQKFHVYSTCTSICPLQSVINLQLGKLSINTNRNILINWVTPVLLMNTLMQISQIVEDEFKYSQVYS